MPTLNELIECMCRYAEANEKYLPKDFCTGFKGELQRQFPGEKIYVPPQSNSKREMIAQSARTLPSGVVAERHGVSRRYVNKVIKKR